MSWQTRTLSCALALAAVAVDPAIGAPHAPAAAARLRPVVALAPFADRTDGRWMLWTGCDAGEGLTQLLADSLTRARGWSVTDRAALGRRLRDDGPGAPRSDEARLAEAGRSLGAAWVVSGAVLEFGVDPPAADTRRRRWALPPGRRTVAARVTLEVRLLDASTGQVLRSERITRERLLSAASSAREHERPIAPLATDGTPLGEALRDAVSSCIAVLEQEAMARWSARVVRVRGGRVELDAGRDTGLVPGHRLTLWRAGVDMVEGTGESVTAGLDEVAAELEVVGFSADGRRARARVLRGSAWVGDTARPWTAWTPRAFSLPGDRSAR